MNDLLAVPQNLLIYFVYNCNFDILPRLAQFNAAMLLNVCCKLASWPRGQILFLASHFPPDENNESGLRLQNCLQFFSLHFTQFSIFNSNSNSILNSKIQYSILAFYTICDAFLINLHLMGITVLPIVHKIDYQSEMQIHIFFFNIRNIWRQR